MSHKGVLAFFLVSLCLFSVGVSAQEVYRWVDEKGGGPHRATAFLSNDP